MLIRYSLVRYSLTGSTIWVWLAMALMPLASAQDERAVSADLFGADFPRLDSLATGRWWEADDPKLLVPRDEVVAFALYTHDQGTLKLSAQLYPLKPDEPQVVRLELQQDGQWQTVAEQPVVYPGWSAHFRIDDWDHSRDVPYRVRHGESAMFEGLIRKDPVDKDVIVVGSLSCNSSRTPGPRPTLVANLQQADPDLLFFAGDQTYKHRQHTDGWLEWGRQFRDLIRDRPVVAIPDDHDVGQANLWGENGKLADNPQGPGGGYFFPVPYVNMVQRCQTWHLPDPVDPQPVERGISVYFTRLRVGGVDFAIIEDRKFKSGPRDKIPRMGPRPDHITDESYDRSAVDLPGLVLLGERQLSFLNDWSADWTAARMKCVLSQTAFCGAVHLHGNPDNRLLADLDSNAWPQTGRNRALREIRRAWATHLCGDQHLAVVVKHGIEQPRDGPWAFTSPAIVNTIYGRWWHPAGEQPGEHAVSDSPLPWTGDYRDGLGNHLFMQAYANPANTSDERQRGDGFGIARFDKRNGTVTFECWPRFAGAEGVAKRQYPGWPVEIRMRDNDGRAVTGHLPRLVADPGSRPVVQVLDESTGEVLYTVRPASDRFAPPVYSEGPFTVRVGRQGPERVLARGLVPLGEGQREEIRIGF